jgi:two-component system cell cycle response regulator
MSEDFGDTPIGVELRHPQVPRVLIVDADPPVSERLRGLVMAAGFDARIVASGAAALSALRKDFTPIVIADRHLPDMDGLTLCRTIRAERFSGYVYLMLLTVQDADADILAGLDAGSDDYLSKRASPAQLVARLRTAQRILTLEHSLRSVVEEKSRLATTDTLTGAGNRRYLMRHLTRELKRVRRFGGEIGVLMLDIDHFKQVNDRHGHSVGDEVLKDVAARISTGLPRDYDWFARTGGQEFVIVLPQTGMNGAKVVAEKLRALIAAQPLRTGVGPVPVTVSIGVSALEAPAQIAGQSELPEMTVDQMLDVADRCLRRSKQDGRNRVSWPDLASRIPTSPPG